MKDNYCVIMGGGIGSRFWPFSRENYPKQFLDFFGSGRTLLQMTFDRFVKIIPLENIYVVTNVAYEALVKEQLPDLPDQQILLEPARLNTAPCVAYAAYHIRARDPEANIVVAPTDHLIIREDVFLDDVQKGLAFVREHDALVTLGIKPSRPETGYGYIQSSEQMCGEFTKVKTFTEKPNLEMAKVFVQSGEFFWNSGLFLWNVNAILKAYERYMPDITLRFNMGLDKFNTPSERDFINEQYPYCRNISVDYGIMEKADNVYMLCADFGWADLGTWGSLYDMAPKGDAGNVVLSNGETMFYESAKNVVAIDNPERLTVVQGINDCIIAESGNVLLICKMGDEQRIKQFVADAQMKYGKRFK